MLNDSDVVMSKEMFVKHIFGINFLKSRFMKKVLIVVFTIIVFVSCSNKEIKVGDICHFSEAFLLDSIYGEWHIMNWHKASDYIGIEDELLVKSKIEKKEWMYVNKHVNVKVVKRVCATEYDVLVLTDDSITLRLKSNQIEKGKLECIEFMPIDSVYNFTGFTRKYFNTIYTNVPIMRTNKGTEVVTKINKQYDIEEVKLNPNNKFQIIGKDGDMCKINWRDEDVIGWIPIEKVDTISVKKLLKNGIDYEILKIEENSVVVNYFVWIKSEISTEKECYYFYKRFVQSVPYNKKRNITFYDKKLNDQLIGDYDFENEDYVTVAEHMIYYVDYDGYYSYYPLMKDSMYKKYGGKKEL